MSKFYKFKSLSGETFDLAISGCQYTVTVNCPNVFQQIPLKEIRDFVQKIEREIIWNLIVEDREGMSLIPDPIPEKCSSLPVMVVTADNKIFYPERPSPPENSILEDFQNLTRIKATELILRESEKPLSAIEIVNKLKEKGFVFAKGGRTSPQHLISNMLWYQLRRKNTLYYTKEISGIRHFGILA